MAKTTTRTGKSTRKAAHIPRPLNAFILFRTHITAKEKAERNQVMQASPVRPKMTPAESKAKFGMESKRISLLYRALPDAEKEEWVQKAKIADAEHKKMYPDYIYTPGPAKKGRRKAAPRPDDDEGRTPPPPPKAVQVNEPSSTNEQRDCGPVRRKKSTRPAPYPSPQRGKKSKTPSQSPPPLSSPSSGSSSSGSSPPLPSPVSEHSQLLNSYNSLSFKGSSDTDQLAAVPHSGVAGPAYSTSFHTTGSGSAVSGPCANWYRSSLIIKSSRRT